MPNAPCGPASPLPPRSARHRWAANRYRSALASRRDWWSSASRSAPAIRASRRRSARRRTSRPACRASPGLDQVVIDAATRRQIGGLFECRTSAPSNSKACRSPVPAWHVLSRKPHARPVRGTAFGRHAAGRPRRGDGAAAPPLGAGEGRQRTGGADFRRTGRGQVPPRRGAGRADRRRTAHSAALFLLAAPSGQRALSGDRADGASGRLRARGRRRRPGLPNCKRCSRPPRRRWKTWR